MRCVGTYPCTGPARGHTVTHAVRLHSALAPRGATPSHMRCVGTLRSLALLHAALVLEGVTPLSNSTLAGAATRCTGPRRGHSPGQLYARRRGYTLRRFSTGHSLGTSTLAGAATRCTGPRRGHTPGELYSPDREHVGNEARSLRRPRTGPNRRAKVRLGLLRTETDRRTTVNSPGPQGPRPATIRWTH